MVYGKPKVLFLCTGNSARSIMAEALLRNYAGDHFEVHSAGLEPKGINPYTIRVLTEKNVDMTGQHSKDVSDYLGRANFGYLITVCGHADANCPTAFLGVSQRMHWHFEDPAAVQGTDEEKLTVFRAMRDARCDRCAHSAMAGGNARFCFWLTQGIALWL